MFSREDLRQQLSIVVLGALSLSLIGLSLAKYFEPGAGQSAGRFALYVGAPAGASAICLVSALFLTAAKRNKLVVCLVAAMIGAIAADIYLASTQKSDREIWRQEFVRRWEIAGHSYDNRSTLEVVNDMRRAGVMAYPKLNPTMLLRSVGAGRSASRLQGNAVELMPLATMSRTHSVYCNETGTYLTYESDAHGFNNPANLWAASAIDVAAVGDSFTEGNCVPSDQNAVAIVRERYPSTLNLGMGANGPLMELATVTEYLTHKRPRIVLWFYFEGNDLIDLRRERRSALLMQYLTASFSQNLLDRQAEIDGAIRGYFDDNMKRFDGDAGGGRFGPMDVLFLRNLRTRLKQTYAADGPPDVDIDGSLDLLARILATAKQRIDAWGGALVFVYLPSKEAFMRGGSPLVHARSRILAQANDLGLRVIDITDTFARDADPLSLFVFRDFGHYNARGYGVVAARVLEELAQIDNAGE